MPKPCGNQWGISFPCMYKPFSLSVGGIKRETLFGIIIEAKHTQTVFRPWNISILSKFASSIVRWLSASMQWSLWRDRFAATYEEHERQDWSVLASSEMRLTRKYVSTKLILCHYSLNPWRGLRYHSGYRFPVAKIGVRRQQPPYCLDSQSVHTLQRRDWLEFT